MKTLMVAIAGANKSVAKKPGLLARTPEAVLQIQCRKQK